MSAFLHSMAGTSRKADALIAKEARITVNGVPLRSDSKPFLKFEAAMLRALGYKWREIAEYQGSSHQLARQRVVSGGAEMACAALRPLLVRTTSLDYDPAVRREDRAGELRTRRKA